jgi:hypothetical protein
MGTGNTRRSDRERGEQLLGRHRLHVGFGEHDVDVTVLDAGERPLGGRAKGDAAGSQDQLLCGGQPLRVVVDPPARGARL